MQNNLIAVLDTKERREIIARIENSLMDLEQRGIVDLGLAEVHLCGHFTPDELCRIAGAQRAVQWTLGRG